MEIKIPKEVHQHRETIFFGLSTRQFICSVLAVGGAVGLYFSLSRGLDRETVSWARRPPVGCASWQPPPSL